MAGWERCTSCRSCGGADLRPVIDLGDQPLANALRKPSDDEPEGRYPLAVVVCGRCSLVQLTITVSPPAMFDNYVYFSSTSTSMVTSMRTLAHRLIAERSLGADDLVVEVASNDGYLLQHYRDRGISVLGVEPAKNVAAVAEAAGIPTAVAYFSESLAADLVEARGRASVIHVNNVAAHVPSINDFVAGLAQLVRPDGVIVLETPHVVKLIERNEFDTIYHEHVFYYSLIALVDLFARHGLEMLDVEQLAVHGGSLRVLAAHSGDRGPRVSQLLAEERALGVDASDYYDGFAERVAQLRTQTIERLCDLKSAGRSLSAYGAAAKGAVLLNHYGLDSEVLDFVVDGNPRKHGYLMPGVGIPISPPERLVCDRPDAVMLLAWNLEDEIVSQQQEYLGTGGSFLVPIPQLRIVGDQGLWAGSLVDPPH